MNSPLYLKQMEVGPMQNFVYLIGDQKTKEAVVVDPAWDIGTVLEKATQEGYQVKGALITHTHFDHVNGLEELLDKTGGLVYVNRNEAEFLKGMKDHIQELDAGDVITLGAVKITSIHTPGHTPGSQCFLVDQNLISGDTLFINACGRCDLPGGNAEQMYQSLKRLAILEENTVLYPGHNYSETTTSTIGKERKSNPYLQSTNLSDFLRYRMGY